jgi:hypothetical protein
MSASVGWHAPENNLVIIQFHLRWTWQDFDDAVDEAYALIRTVPQPVAAIIDFTGASGFPDPHIIEHLRRSIHTRPENFDLMVIAGVSPILHEVSVALRYLLPQPHQKFSTQFTATLAQAEALILSQRTERT